MSSATSAQWAAKSPVVPAVGLIQCVSANGAGVHGGLL